ncbi:MAG: 50S ribosomal protein L5 [Chloroflexi bacterium]|nr:50S ribosomal protein L5 [Chloroflexota bacterium]
MPDSEPPQDNLASEDNLQSDAPNEEIAEEQTSSTRPRRQRTTRSRQSERSEGDSSGNSPAEPPPAPRLLETYRTEIVSTMMSEFGYHNTMRVPRIRKVTLNIGLGEALTNGRAMEAAVQDLATISGQKPVITRAKKSIANFKLREGNQIGTSVTLRGARMYHFLDRLVNTALPRIRDFRGISRRGFDGRGNFSIGIREQIIFPEIDYNQIDRIRGLQVTIGTTATNDPEAMRLLELFGMPFVSQD